MSAIPGAKNLHRAVSVNASYDTTSELKDYLTRKLRKLGYYTVYNGLIERPGNVNVFVIDLKGKSAEGRPLYENGIPILYYNTSSVADNDEDSGSDAEDSGSDAEDNGPDAEDIGSDAEDSGSDAEDSGSDAEDSGSDAEGSGSDDEETKTVVTAKSSGNDKELRKTARAIANTIKGMHIASDRTDLVRKIHQLGDVVLAKAYTRTVFDSSNKFNSEDERRQCKAGIDDAALDFVFLDVIKNMPEISPPR